MRSNEKVLKVQKKSDDQFSRFLTFLTQKFQFFSFFQLLGLIARKRSVFRSSRLWTELTSIDEGVQNRKFHVSPTISFWDISEKSVKTEKKQRFYTEN